MAEIAKPSVEAEGRRHQSPKLADVEKIVLEMYKSGETPAKIGLVLRDKHGVPKTKALGKRIVDIIRGAKLDVKLQKDAIAGKIAVLSKHSEKNKHDQSAKRKLLKYHWDLKRAQEYGTAL